MMAVFQVHLDISYPRPEINLLQEGLVYFGEKWHFKITIWELRILITTGVAIISLSLRWTGLKYRYIYKDATPH